ncbi:SusC/RagA family TonB-linked outer membrane protein [Echinicola jeungdonensis]|uniref:SusC/RagA family TonB-linked outer membrane protein n=1 Tax=Echinicola jeungdonensis TaxID=709343 RepID=A0ABV5J3U5_9BACT|nr:SusC/RagA family TonB-linked outer membrane protein [Echinicola jeungdonensis]MDN3669326.1 SusC/RagA family TonB-linked outer membrane protein [Echinicola jeungdonensis]
MKNTLPRFPWKYGVLLLGSCLYLNTSQANQNFKGNVLHEAVAMRTQEKDLNSRLTVDFDNASVQEVFSKIQSKTGFKFVYDKKTLSLDQTFTIKGSNITLYDLLQEISQSSPLRFKQVNENINVRIADNVPSMEVAVEITVKGKVTDSDGNPLPGASILMEGTQNGTVTDLDGNYSIEVPEGAKLVVSYIGFQSKSIAVNNQSVINVVLENDFSSLEEVVVVGYGEVKKKDLTGAVVSLGNKDITKRGTTSPLAALQGQVAGVNITANSGLPGTDFDINIRGVNSLSGGSPLYVVDGVMTDNINFLNPNDIDRIDILKDASSTAIYGSRGSNGVVIVTTKSGEFSEGKASIQYSGFVGMRTISNIPDFLNAEEAIEYTKNRGIVGLIYSGSEITAPDGLFGFPSSGDAHDYWVENLGNKNYYDWVGELTKPGLNTNHFISASGGSKNVNYVVGVGYQGDNGNVTAQGYEKYNFKANVTGKVSEKWEMGANLNLAYTDKELRSRNVMKQLFRMPPYAPAYNSEGDLIRQPMLGISGNVSPLAELKYNKFNTQEYYLVSNFHLQYKPIDGIRLRSTLSPNVKFQRVGEYWDKLSTGSGNGGYMATDQRFSYVWDNQLHLNKTIGDHQIDYDFIFSMLMDRNEYLYGFGWDSPFNSEFYNLGSATYLNTASNFSKSTLMSYTNRINYSYKSKYMLTATARWDGSSRLAPGHKWAFFPSVGSAWIISEEDFLQGSSALNNLKLRLSFGYTGNDNIAPYSTQFGVNDQTYYDFNGNLANGFKPSSIANKDLTWERTREWNLGVDFGFYNNRITGELNVYDKKSLNLLMERKLAVPTGWASMMDNVGSVSNKGIEIQLNTVNIETGDFTWETSFNFSKNQNKIVELYGKKEDDVPNRWFIGQPVDVVYAMEFVGVWQKDEVPEGNNTLEGTAKVKDQNGDGVIDIDNDMKILGSPLPSWTGGLSSSFAYKNFDLSVSLYSKQGVFLYSPFHREFTDFNSKQILDVPYYMRENPITEARYSNTYPQPRNQGQYWGEDAEDYGYPGYNKDASFVRLQNITMGYNLGSSLMERLSIQSCRVYVNVINPFVWTKYDGFDPEWADASMSGENSTSNAFSVYQFGTNIKF